LEKIILGNRTRLFAREERPERRKGSNTTGMGVSVGSLGNLRRDTGEACRKRK